MLTTEVTPEIWPFEIRHITSCFVDVGAGDGFHVVVVGAHGFAAGGDNRTCGAAASAAGTSKADSAAERHEINNRAGPQGRSLAGAADHLDSRPL